MNTTWVSAAAGCQKSLLSFVDMRYIVDTFEDCQDEVQALLPGEAGSLGRRPATESQVLRNLYMTANPSRTATELLRTNSYGTSP